MGGCVDATTVHESPRTTFSYLSQRRRRFASRMICCRAPPNRLLLRVEVTSECSALSYYL